jgi:hypothetical protein
LEKRSEILARAKKRAAETGRAEIAWEISRSCQLAAHEIPDLAAEIGNYRWLELVENSARRVDALIAKFAKVVFVHADKFPIFFPKLDELRAKFDCVVFDAADCDADVLLAAALPGVRRVLLSGGGRVVARLRRLNSL